MVRDWLDSWTGVWHVVDAMHKEDYNLPLMRAPLSVDDSADGEGCKGWRIPLGNRTRATGRPARVALPNANPAASSSLRLRR
jgi:hypothetical protein